MEGPVYKFFRAWRRWACSGTWSPKRCRGLDPADSPGLAPGQVVNNRSPETREWATRLAKHLRDRYPAQHFRGVEEILGDHRILA
jgi:hypothetical protein